MCVRLFLIEYTLPPWKYSNLIITWLSLWYSRKFYSQTYCYLKIIIFVWISFNPMRKKICAKLHTRNSWSLDQFDQLDVCRNITCSSLCAEILHVVIWVPCFHFGKTIDEKCTYTEMMVQFKKNGCLLILRSKVSLCFFTAVWSVFI